jgi:Saxitoxin biosynthesis operon protein SxtJ
VPGFAAWPAAQADRLRRPRWRNGQPWTNIPPEPPSRPLASEIGVVTHEDFSRHEDIKPSSDRNFGLVMATVFLVVTFWPLTHAEPVRWWALAVAAVFAVLALMWTAALAPLNKWWTKLGILLYRIVSPIVLGFLFYVTVTPIALLMRLRGKDPLRLRRDPDTASYWIDRTPPGPAPESMKNQF